MQRTLDFDLEGSCSIQLSYGRADKEECRRKN
jgi:hypothetical protein